MEALFPYLLKSSGLLAVFYLAYHFLVRKETFFNSNRWFLITGILASLLLPFYFIKKVILVERPAIPVRDLVVNTIPQPDTTLHTIPVVEPFDWMQLVWIGYGIIVCILAAKIVLNLISLYRMLYRRQVVKKEGFKFVNLNENIAPFSFFNYIVYNADLYSNEELQSILLHEKIHSREKHSIDVFIAELFCALFWFNPFAWLYKKAIIQNLEYIADQKAIEQIDDKKSYQHALLKVVSNQNCLPITNNFYQSLIKKRIIMLNQNQSSKRNLWKYAVVIPSLIAFVLLFQIKVIARDKFPTINDIVTNTGTSTNLNTVEEETSTIMPATEGEGSYVFDKTETDQNLKDDVTDIEQSHKINFVISNVKRNSNGEIIAIKMAFDDKNGNTGKVEQNRDIPIRPIFFQIKQKDGKSAIGFYDNPDMVVKPVDPVNENKIIAIEAIKDDALIYVDGDRYDKENLNELDPKGLEKIEILTDATSLAQYGAGDKDAVVVITTNWSTRQEKQNKPTIIRLENGDDLVVYNRYNMKVIGYPAVQFTDNSPVFILNGVEQKNPRLTLETMPLLKIKTVKVLDANDKETKGTPIYKLIVSTK